MVRAWEAIVTVQKAYITSLDLRTSRIGCGLSSVTNERYSTCGTRSEKLADSASNPRRLI